MKYPTFTTELSLFPTSVTDMLFAAILLVAVTLATFKLSDNANPVSSTVKFVSSSFNLTDILLSFSSSIAIPLPAVYVSPPPSLYSSPLILIPVKVSPSVAVSVPLSPSTLEPASTVNLATSVFPSSPIEPNWILTSLPSFPLFSVFLIVIVPGILAPPLGLPSESASPLVCNPIVPPLDDAAAST